MSEPHGARRLVLFDIDGTLLRIEGAGKRAVAHAFAEVYRCEAPLESIEFAGRTDLGIAHDLLERAGVGPPDGRLETLWSAYEEALAAALGDEPDAAPLPGVPELLDAIDRHRRATNALLTGNVSGGARLKLGAVGIDVERFAVRVFGADARERNALAPRALQEAASWYGGPVAPRELVFVGDTPADVECGRSIGARTVAVATGWFDRTTLEGAGADVVLDDLSDTERVLNAIVA